MFDIYIKITLNEHNPLIFPFASHRLLYIFYFFFLFQLFPSSLSHVFLIISCRWKWVNQPETQHTQPWWKWGELCAQHSLDEPTWNDCSLLHIPGAQSLGPCPTCRCVCTEMCVGGILLAAPLPLVCITRHIIKLSVSQWTLK